MNFKNFLKKIGNAVTLKKQPKNEANEELINELSKNQFLKQQKQTTMSMFNYGVGGNEVKVDANEAINEIQHNKTMLISQLTAEAPIQPEPAVGLKTVEDVFRHFQPAVNVEMQTADGQTVKENLQFANLGDFTPKSIINQSDFLNNLNVQQTQYLKIMKQLRTNKVLKNLLENEETRDALIQAIKNAASELEQQ
jgi:predicted transcriptional regulator